MMDASATGAKLALTQSVAGLRLKSLFLYQRPGRRLGVANWLGSMAMIWAFGLLKSRSRQSRRKEANPTRNSFLIKHRRIAVEHQRAHPRCTACNADRKLVFEERVAMTYEMRSYRCPICRTEVRVVEPSERPGKIGRAQSFH